MTIYELVWWGLKMFICAASFTGVQEWLRTRLCRSPLNWETRTKTVIWGVRPGSWRRDIDDVSALFLFVFIYFPLVFASPPLPTLRNIPRSPWYYFYFMSRKNETRHTTHRSLQLHSSMEAEVHLYVSTLQFNTQGWFHHRDMFSFMASFGLLLIFAMCLLLKCIRTCQVCLY